MDRETFGTKKWAECLELRILTLIAQQYTALACPKERAQKGTVLSEILKE